MTLYLVWTEIKSLQECEVGEFAHAFIEQRSAEKSPSKRWICLEVVKLGT